MNCDSGIFRNEFIHHSRKTSIINYTTRIVWSSPFCEAVVRAGKETAIAINRKCEGWYTASKDILAPAIQEKNRLRHHLHDSGSLNPSVIAAITMQLKLVNKRNHDLVEMAKAKWYKGVCSKIHEMNMDP